MNNLNLLKIKQLLNRSLTRMDRSTLERLRDSRAQALAQYGVRRTASSFAWAGKTPWETLGHAFSGPQKTHFWVVAVLFIILLFGATLYSQQTAEPDTTDVDIAILTDELPIHVYLD